MSFVIKQLFHAKSPRTLSKEKKFIFANLASLREIIFEEE